MMQKTTLVDIHKVKRVRPQFDVYIGRHVRYQPEWPNTKWGNKFFKQLDRYEEYVRQNLWEDLEELRGKRLGCWCITTDQLEPVQCHGQILMKLLIEKSLLDGWVEVSKEMEEEE